MAGPILQETLDALAVTYAPRNLMLILTSWLAWTALWFASYYVLPVLAPGLIKAIENKEKADLARKGKTGQKLKNVAYLHTVVVAMTHAIYVSQGCLRALMNLDPSLQKDHIYGHSDLSEYYCAVAAGYFVFDIMVVYLDGWGLAFYVHGIACFLVYSLANYPFLHYHGMFFLLFEFSTPFMHLRWLFINTGNGSGLLYNLVGYAFAVAFFIVRILIGYPVSYYWWKDMLALLAAGKAHSVIIVCTYLLMNVVLCGLNGFWFFQILAVALGGGKKKHGASGEKKKQQQKQKDKKGQE